MAGLRPLEATQDLGLCIAARARAGFGVIMQIPQPPEESEGADHQDD